jgi:peptide/nickel transport system permease protein
MSLISAPVETPVPPPPVGRFALLRRRFQRSRLGLLGVGLIALLVVGAFVAPLLYPWDHRALDDTAILAPPSPAHWFGTGKLGEDLFARCMIGLQKSLLIGLLVALISTGLATVVGTVAGYLGGSTGRWLMLLVDLLLVLPAFLVVVVASPVLRNQSWLWLVVLLAGFSWMVMARVVRGMTLSLREREFVVAARLMGMPAWRVITRHIVPNLASILIIDATLGVGFAILAETSLSYFGLGIQFPDVSLGTLIGSGTESALTFSWLFVFPGAVLVLTILAVNFVGEGLRDALDPGAKLRRPA